MTDSFWPEGYDNPAFRVRRSTYGVVLGGDYVRGSGVSTLPRTALRYPTQAPGVPAAIGKGLLFAKPYADGKDATDYHTVQIVWGWPPSIEETWQEVALVRSSYGHPSTPSEGETVFRALRGALSTTADGTVIAPVVLDGDLPSGWWYYYTLFFRVTVDWVAVMDDGCLLPANYGHQGHLWDGMPPFYQWTDDNYRVGDGFLRQFLDIFGFYLDNTRGFVEGVLNLHWIDRSPMALLKHLGANYGMPYEAGLGDVRYRALLANLSNLYQSRGTARSLEDLVETTSKYESDVVRGDNQMLLNDDSDFFTGTGNWTPLHPSTPVTAVQPQYLNPTAGPTTTPNFAGAQLTGDVVFVAKVRKTTGTAAGYLASKLDSTGSTNVAFTFAAQSGLRVSLSTSGTAFTHFYTISTQAQLDALPTGVDFYLAVAIDQNNGTGNSRAEGFYSTDGVTWTSFGTPVLQSVWANNFNSTAPLTIGVYPNGSSPWPGRLYWVEQRTGLVPNAGSVVWRFNADEYSGTGTSYTDPRGKTWTVPVAGVTTLGLTAWTNVTLTSSTTIPTPTETPGARGVMRVDTPQAVQTENVMICLGDGIYRIPGPPVSDREVIPLYGGIAAEPLETFGFSIWAKSEKANVTFTPYLLWFDKTGQPVAYINKTVGLPWVSTLVWHQLQASGAAPAGAVYLVPAVLITTRQTGGATAGRSPYADFAAGTIYSQASDSPVTTIAPDRYLTMGDAGEQIGAPKPGFEGFLIGTP